jgi:hypothetical protein
MLLTMLDVLTIQIRAADHSPRTRRPLNLARYELRNVGHAHRFEFVVLFRLDQLTTDLLRRGHIQSKDTGIHNKPTQTVA